VIAGALLFGGANWLALQFNKPDLGLVFRLFALVLPLASGLKVAASASRISQQMRYGILSEEIVQPVLNLCLIGLFFILGLGMKGAIWASTLSFGVGLLLAFIHLRTLFAGDMGKIRLDLGLSKTLLSRSAPIAAATIFTTLMLLVDRILVGYFLSESEAGIYQAISIFAVFFITILSALKIMAAPMVSTAFHRGDLAELRQLFHLSTRWGLYLTLPVAGVLLAASEQSIQLLFGAEYSAGGLALTWLILAQVANMISGPVEFFLIMTGHSARWVGITAAMLVANLSLNWVLIPRLGILGAAVATLVSFGGTSLLATLSVRRLIGIWPFSRGYGKIAIAAAVMSLGLWVFLGAELTDPLVVLPSFAALACLGFVGTLILLGLEPEERQLLQQAAIRIGLRR
jgi:O-antigen/teichoic acid export membrane protein